MVARHQSAPPPTVGDYRPLNGTGRTLDDANAARATVVLALLLVWSAIEEKMTIRDSHACSFDE